MTVPLLQPIPRENTGRLSLAQWLAQTSSCEKSALAIAREIFSLRRGPGGLSAEDYFYYRLYDDSLFDHDAKRRFLSNRWRVHYGVILKCCDPQWWATADDKLLSYLILRGYPIPETQAAFTPQPRVCGVPVLRSVEALQDFLLNAARYPLFVKPIGGVGSYGAASLDAIDRPARRLLLYGGGDVELAEFCGEIAAAPGDGYLFQSRLTPHPEIAAAIGDRSSTVRVMLIVPDKEPEIIHTVWKIPVGTNIADNFWRPGSLLADVDQDGGRVRRVVRGVGAEHAEVELHPDTGQRLQGMTLPDWLRLKSLVLECAAIFPKLRYQSWDVAMTPSGPVLVEVNTGGAFNLPQLATGKGMLDGRFREFLVKCKYLRR